MYFITRRRRVNSLYDVFMLIYALADTVVRQAGFKKIYFSVNMAIEMNRRCSIYLGIMRIFRRQESKLVIKNWGLKWTPEHLNWFTSSK